ncbi:hypothetical protein [Bacillus altitudinis]|uniref:response regulator aspartate phosphatase n=1 Tax=Bacillus TaxID=1386 RepID=UPI001FB7C0D6|nr:hypothetical protein [Bacillus altitudinis]UOG08835.1 hypothetical protein MTX65_06130 [Bacillus altitudinis]
MEKVLSSHVGLKINEWYYHIQRFNVPDAEAYKEEIKSMIVIGGRKSRCIIVFLTLGAQT